MRLHTAAPHHRLGPPAPSPAHATTAERALLLAVAALMALAALLPAAALPTGYHEFADQRAWLGLPHAIDVLSNLPFAALGVWGLAWLRRVPPARIGAAQRGLAALFFFGLVATTLCSWASRASSRVVWSPRLGLILCPLRSRASTAPVLGRR